MARKVPKEYTIGSDQYNAQKAWLHGYDTAVRDINSVSFHRDDCIRVPEHKYFDGCFCEGCQNGGLTEFKEERSV
jgi:hypothetical protein